MFAKQICQLNPEADKVQIDSLYKAISAIDGKEGVSAYDIAALSLNLNNLEDTSDTKKRALSAFIKQKPTIIENPATITHTFAPVAEALKQWEKNTPESMQLIDSKRNHALD